MWTLDTNTNNKRVHEECFHNNIHDKTQEKRKQQSHKKQKTNNHNNNATTNTINDNKAPQQRISSLAFDVQEVKKFDLRKAIYPHLTSKQDSQYIHAIKPKSKKKFGLGDVCDICDKHDGFKGMNMQKCKSCGIFVHENCYGLEHKKFALGNLFKYPDWECHACAAVGRKVTIKDHRKNDASTIIHIEERPMQCALCKVKSKTAAMHPIYDKHGANGQHAKKNNKLQWVHTICATVVNRLANSNFVYGCDEKGNYQDVDDQDNEEETNKDNVQLQSPFNVWPHHFVITSRLDDAPAEVMEQLKEFRHQKCEICDNCDEQNTKRIVVQCSYDEDCTTAYHVGCAKWGAGGNHQLIEFDPRTQCCNLICRTHSNKKKKKSLQCHLASEKHAEAKQVDMKPTSTKYQKLKEFDRQIYRDMRKDLMAAIEQSETWKEYNKKKDNRKFHYKRELTRRQFDKLWNMSTEDVLPIANSKFDGTDEGDCIVSSASVAKTPTKTVTASGEQSKRTSSLESNVHRKEKEMKRSPSSAKKASYTNSKNEATSYSLSHPETPQLATESRSDDEAISSKETPQSETTRPQQKQLTQTLIITMGLEEEIKNES